MQAPVPSRKIAKNDFLITLCNSIKEGAAIVEKDTKKIIFCNDAWFRLFEVDPLAKMDMMQINQLRKIELTDNEVENRITIAEKEGFFVSRQNIYLKKGGRFGENCRSSRLRIKKVFIMSL